MDERITFISQFDKNNLEKIDSHLSIIEEKLCKVPFSKNVENRYLADTLPYHFTLSAWNIKNKDLVLKELSKIEYQKIKIHISDIDIMNGAENSYVLYYKIADNKALKHLHEKIYKALPTEKYNPETFHFHITIHIDKDYSKISSIKDKPQNSFTPFDLEVSTYALYSIYPATLISQYSIIINDKEYEEISPTAIATLYPKTFTDIPYEKEIYKWVEEHCDKKVALYKNLAPEIEARFKLTNKLLNKSKITQVLELAAGYSSRGLTYSKKGYTYVELDLESITNDKKKIIKSIINAIPKDLHIISGNALKKEDFLKLEKYFNPNQDLVVINEGLLRYLTFQEKRQVATNIYDLLSKYGGIWITCDVTPKKFITSQNKALPNFNNNLSTITTRNNLNDRFEDENHIRKFFKEIGFDIIEIHKFNEMREELYSINELGIINDDIEKTLDDAIAVIMRVNKS